MKTLITYLILLSCIISACSNSNYIINREAFNLKIAVDSSSYYQEDVKEAPYILPDNSIQMYPGENIFIEFELNGKEIKSLKAVKENLNPEKTVEISFKQIAKDRKHDMMILAITNPFDYKLEYTAMIFLLKHNKWVPTSVIPVEEKLMSYETWPDIILSITLQEFTFK